MHYPTFVHHWFSYKKQRNHPRLKINTRYPTEKISTCYFSDGKTDTIHDTLYIYSQEVQVRVLVLGEGGKGRELFVSYSVNLVSLGIWVWTS